VVYEKNEYYMNRKGYNCGKRAVCGENRDYAASLKNAVDFLVV
jgi:hypothetical protein